MSEYIVQHDTMVGIADAIREKTGTTDEMTAAEMPDTIRSIKAGGFPNGTEWTASNLTPVAISMIKYCNGIWVASSTTDGLYYSTDGITWNSSNITSNIRIRGIFYNDGVWHAPGLSGQSYYSLDGKTWMATNLPNGIVAVFKKLNDTWFAAFSGSMGLYCSSDGISWTKTNIAKLVDVECYIAGNYIAAAGASNVDSGIYYSADGITWSHSNISTGAYRVCQRPDSVLLAYTGGGLLYSVDGITWTYSNLTTGTYSKPYNTDAGVSLVSTNAGNILYSLDGKTWNESNVVSGAYCYSFYYNRGVYLAYGASGDSINNTCYSTDGITWAATSLPQIFIRDISHNNGLWVISTQNNGVYYSDDGINWTQSNITTGNHTLNYGCCVWLALQSSSNRVVGTYYSVDGKNWSPTNLMSHRFGTTVHDNGVWVGYETTTKTIYYSITWQPS